MKLRKAIRLAAAGAIVGAMPMMAAHAVGPIDYIGNWSGDTGTGAITFTCPTNFTCDTANAIDDGDFYQVLMTSDIDQSGADAGDAFFQTIQYSIEEGEFIAANVVAQEGNTGGFNGGIGSTQTVSEGGDFTVTANVFGGDFRDANVVDVGTSPAGVGAGLGIIDIHQDVDNGANVVDISSGRKNGGGRNDGFTTVNLASDIVVDFERNTVETFGDMSNDGLDSMTQSVKHVLSSSNALGSVDQTFILNEAEGAAVSDSGLITAGGTGGGTQTVAFTAGQTIVGMTIQSEVSGAPAFFSLSDIANESDDIGEGVDSLSGAPAFVGVDYTGGLETSHDPFIDFQ